MRRGCWQLDQIVHAWSATGEREQRRPGDDTVDTESGSHASRLCAVRLQPHCAWCCNRTASPYHGRIITAASALQQYRCTIFHLTHTTTAFGSVVMTEKVSSSAPAALSCQRSHKPAK